MAVSPKTDRPHTEPALERSELDHELDQQALTDRLAQVLDAARCPDDFFCALELLFARLSGDQASAGDRLFARAVNADALAESLHELRSLVTALFGGLDAADSAMQRLFGGRSAEQLPRADVVDLIESLNDAMAAAQQCLAVSARGHEQTTHQATDLGACLGRGVRLVSPERPEHVSLVLRTEAIEGVAIVANEGHVLQVVLNLLNNAFEALSDQPEGRVVLDGWTSPTMAFFSVADDGPGFAALHLEAARAGEHVLSTKPAGSGLGLSICHRLIRSWNGVFEIDARTDQGASVVVGVPLAATSLCAESSPKPR